MTRILVLFLLVTTLACGSANDITHPTGEWTLKTLPGEDISVLKKPITLVFTTNAKANGFAGCNQYFGSVTTNQSAIEFTGMGSTKMFCQETMNLEDKFLSALAKSNVFRVEGNSLQLLQGDIVLLEFEK